MRRLLPVAVALALSLPALLLALPRARLPAGGTGAALAQEEAAPTPTPTPRPKSRDLHPTALAGPAAARPGQPLAVSWTAQNRGRSRIDVAWFDAVLLSFDDVFDAGDIVLGALRQDLAVEGRGGYSQSATVTLSSVPAGPYFILLKIDYFDNVVELDEGNNTTAIPITVTE